MDYVDLCQTLIESEAEVEDSATEVGLRETLRIKVLQQIVDLLAQITGFLKFTIQTPE